MTIIKPKRSSVILDNSVLTKLQLRKNEGWLWLEMNCFFGLTCFVLFKGVKFDLSFTQNFRYEKSEKKG